MTVLMLPLGSLSDIDSIINTHREMHQQLKIIQFSEMCENQPELNLAR